MVRIIIVIGLVLYHSVSFSQEINQDISLYFDPSLLACTMNNNNYYDCEVVENETDTNIKVKLDLSYVINNVEFWSGSYSKKLVYNDHEDEFKISVEMQSEQGSQLKSYDIKIQIVDSLAGTYSTTIRTDSIDKINLAEIQLPEIKSGKSSYFVSLNYSALTLAINRNRVENIVDMVFDSSQLGKVNILGTVPVKVTPWEDGVLPIVFKSGMSEQVKKTILDACLEWSTVANVRCVLGAYKNRKLIISNNYMGIDGGCWSMLGQDTYFLWLKRRMNIGSGCESYAVILHELGHAFGLGHEHQRPDRDDFIRIVKENIADPYLGLNTKLNFSTQAGHVLTPYDFDSIMHYSKYAFSKNGKETILPQTGYEQYLNTMGHAQHLSQNDIVAIQMIYGSRKDKLE